MIPRAKKSAVSDSDILMYVALAVKHLRLMVLLICFALMFGMVYYTWARPVFYSKALVRVQTLARPVDTEKIFRDSSRRAMLTEIASANIVGRAAKRLGVNVAQRDIQRKYLRKVVVRMPSEDNITVEVWPYNVEWAKKLPEALVQEYLLWRDERRLERIQLTFESFTEDMDQLKKRMDEVYNSKFDFRDSNQVTSAIIDLNRLKELPRELQTVKHQLAIMDGTREALNNPGRETVAKLALLSSSEQSRKATEANASQMIPHLSVGQVVPQEQDASSGIVVIPSMVASPLREPWEEYDKERMKLLQQDRDLGRVYLPNHPKVAAVRKQLAAVDKALDLELDVALTRFNLEHANLVDRQHELESRLPEYDNLTRRYEKFVQEYRHFDSGQVAWAKIYNEMSKKLDTMDFGADKERSQLMYSGLMELRDKPVSPNRFKLALYFLVLGVALAVAVPFLIEYVDSRITDVEQAEESLRIRSLGVVPKISDVPVDHVVLSHGDSKSDHHLQENFRLIRTNLIMTSSSPALPQVILVTSAMPQEGKTVVAANLAASFARKGEKTLLIDADLRRGRLHRLFACPNRPGLSEVLTENRPVAEACRVVGNGDINGNLTLMTCGKHIHFASELLDSAVFPKLMDELRQKYQRIVVDTPPVLGLSETSIIQRTADGVLLVIWSDATSLSNVKTAVQTLQTNGAKFAGFVLNRLDFAALTNRYKYFYYSPHYYANYQPLDPPPPQLTSAGN